MTENEPLGVLACFTVALSGDGSPMVFMGDIPQMVAAREATMDDVRKSCREIADDFTARLTAAYTSEMVAQRLAPAQDPTPSQRVSDALSRREYAGTEETD